jgi:Family of unknown function (DUF5681)
MTRNSEARKIINGDITSSASPKTPRPWLSPPWEPGKSGNPAGRPRGARSRLSELTLTKLLADFELHGDAAITEVRSKNPAAYLASIVSLLPKQQEKIESPFADLTTEELDLLEHFLKSTRAKTVTTIDATAEPETPA